MLSDLLLNWFRPQKSEHFFRFNRSPYKTWVSEVALQQTRLEAALPILESFLNIFPTIETLAEASLEDVKQAWSGLGYYRRAENLKKGAVYVREHFAGQLPKEPAQLKTIPSIGDYTAAAIASLCFAKKAPAIDGNILRIVARLRALPLPQNSNELKGAAYQFVQDEMENSNANPGEINEALMELGQKLCRPQKPHCLQCPLGQACKTSKEGNPQDYPQKLKKELIPLNLYAKAVIIHGKVLLEKSEQSPFLKNQWGLPYYVEGTAQLPANKATPLAISFGASNYKIAAKGFSSITKYKIKAYIEIIDNTEAELYQENIFTVDEARQLCVSSLHKKLILTLQDYLNSDELF